MRNIIIVDPALCAVPSVVSEKDDVIQIVLTLRELSKMARVDRGACVYCIENLPSVLASANYFPLSDSIKEMLDHYDLSAVYTVEEIRRTVISIMERASAIEVLSEVDFLIPYGSSIVPREVDIPGSAVLSEALHVLFAHAGIMINRRGVPIGLVSAAMNFGAKDLESVGFKGLATDIQPPLPENEVELDFSLPIFRSIDGLLRSTSPSDIWNVANAQAEVAEAIKLLAFQILLGANPKACIEDVPEFSIGDDFFGSLVTWGCGPSGKFSNCTLEVCARVLIGLPKYEVKKFLARVSAKGQGLVHKKRTKDGALAFRTHVSKDHEALRLMFWRNKDNHIEFANVGSKKELVIAE
ncbi:MAG TPA: hypothetical protein VED40_14385 [Azospirillaceae bacterium]|nr:hypothetical protein [Azospirillaceae bacterium]